MKKMMILLVIATWLVGCGRWRDDEQRYAETDALMDQIDQLETTTEQLDDIDEDLIMDEETGAHIDSLLLAIDQVTAVFNSLDDIREEEIYQP